MKYYEPNLGIVKEFCVDHVKKSKNYCQFESSNWCAEKILKKFAGAFVFIQKQLPNS